MNIGTKDERIVAFILSLLIEMCIRDRMPYAEPLVKILDKSQFIGHFNTDQFREKVNATFQKLVRGDIKNVDQALITMEKELNGIIKK